MLTDIKSLTRDELETQFKTWEQPAYRVGATARMALYPPRHGLGGDDEPAQAVAGKAARKHFPCKRWNSSASRGRAIPRKNFSGGSHDHSLIESVLIPANPALYGDASDRHTLCVSTQVGCAYGCKFCASGLDGWKRNLTPDEIVEQVIWRSKG